MELMDNVLQVQIRTVYGNQLVYPVNTLAIRFANLLGVKTFNKQQVAHIREMGYIVGQVVMEVVL